MKPWVSLFVIPQFLVDLFVEERFALVFHSESPGFFT